MNTCSRFILRYQSSGSSILLKTDPQSPCGGVKFRGLLKVDVISWRGRLWSEVGAESSCDQGFYLHNLLWSISLELLTVVLYNYVIKPYDCARSLQEESVRRVQLDSQWNEIVVSAFTVNCCTNCCQVRWHVDLSTWTHMGKLLQNFSRCVTLSSI